MLWNNRLYVGEKAEPHKKKIVKNIKNNKVQLGIYVLALPANEENVMDIYPAQVLLQEHFKKSNQLIVGVAKGRDEAMELMMQIITDSINETGSYRVRDLVEKYS